MLGLATSNFLNGMLGTLGLRVLYYYNTGPLVVSTIYFVAKRQGCFDIFEKTPKRGLRETGIYPARNFTRDLLRTDDDKFDYNMLLKIVFAAAIQAGITILLNRTFYLSKLAHLNIGVAQSVQACQAFIIAVADYFVFGKGLTTSQFVGMFVIVGGIVSISLSSIDFSGKETAEGTMSVEHEANEATVPVIVPLLVSLTVPVFMSMNVMLAKQVTTVNKVSGRDFTFAFFLLFSATTFLAAMVFF